MTVYDEIANDGTERIVEKLRQENTSLKARLQAAQDEIDKLSTVKGLFDACAGRAEPPAWLRRKPGTGHRGVPVAFLSDTHFDEVVNPEEIRHLNAYNREIATLRLETWAQKLVEVTDLYMSKITLDGLVVCLGGDLFSGNIHDELKETNEDVITGSLVYWYGQMIGALSFLADEFGLVYVPAVSGNHPRLTAKPRAKLRARDNFDWLLAKLLELHFADDERFTFDVSESPDALFDVYETRHLICHGDQVKGGGGIGGIWPPIKRMEARKRERMSFDVLAMGHWHQLIQTNSMIVNGALKGVDEFAMNVLNCKPERAQQAIWLVTPERGVTLHTAIHCDNPKKEGWA